MDSIRCFTGSAPGGSCASEAKRSSQLGSAKSGISGAALSAGKQNRDSRGGTAMRKPQVYLMELYGGTVQFIHGPITESQAKNIMESYYSAELKAERIPLLPRYVMLMAVEIPREDLLKQPELRKTTPGQDRRRAFTERRIDGTEATPKEETPTEDEGGPFSEAAPPLIGSSDEEYRAAGYAFNPETGAAL